MNEEGKVPLVSSIPSEVQDAKDVLMAKDLEEQIRSRLNANLKEIYELVLKGHTVGEIAKRFS